MAKAKPIDNLDIQADTGQNARQIARIRLEEVYAWNEAVDSPYAVRELHNLRIAAKRLRYTLEIFADFLPDNCKPLVQELEQVQEELGQLHDSDVLIALLRLCLGGLEDPATGQTLANAQQDKRAKKQPKTFLQPGLVKELLDPSVAPTAKERFGLEQFLAQLFAARGEQYQAFRQHWYRLQARDFRRQLLTLLDTEA